MIKRERYQMKTRHGLVSNSSSTSFMINIGNIKDPEIYQNLMQEINTINCYIEVPGENKNSLYVSTGMSCGSTCLFNWWKIQKWLIDHKISFQCVGDGTPDAQQKVCDFVIYITSDNNEEKPDPEKVQEFKDWYYRNTTSKRIERDLLSAGLTRKDIEDDLKDGDANMIELYADLIKE
jgi:hypothetical protein